MKPIQIFIRITPHDGGRETNKNRPPWFSKEACYLNMVKNVNSNLADVTYFFDGDPALHKEHFLLKKKPTVNVLATLQGGSDAATFYYLMKYVAAQQFAPDTIIYLVEDDYLHRPNFCKILLEGASINQHGYFTLYDHPDKYWKFVYPTLKSEILHSENCHWREIPSTTSTFALTHRTLLEDLNESLQFCDIPNKANWDHKRFVYLVNKGRKILSCMPGWSTHSMAQYLSPTIKWENHV